MSKPRERGSRRSGEDRQTRAAGPGAARPQRTCAGDGVALRRDRGAEAGHAISAGSFLDPGLGGPPPSWRLLRRASLERVRGRASLPSRPHAPGSPGSRRQPAGRRLAHSAPILGQAGDSPLGSGAGRGPGPSRPCAAASPAPLPPGRCVPPAAVPPGFERARDPGLDAEPGSGAAASPRPATRGRCRPAAAPPRGAAQAQEPGTSALSFRARPGRVRRRPGPPRACSSCQVGAGGAGRGGGGLGSRGRPRSSCPLAPRSLARHHVRRVQAGAPAHRPRVLHVLQLLQQQRAQPRGGRDLAALRVPPQPRRRGRRPRGPRGVSSACAPPPRLPPLFPLPVGTAACPGASYLLFCFSSKLCEHLPCARW